MVQESFILTRDNYREFQIAFGKVFWMYHDMVTTYSGFGHNIDFEHIEYERFFFASADEDMDGIYPDQMEIVRQGAFVALCCEVVNLLDEERRNKKVYQFITKTLENPKIESMPLEKETLIAMRKSLDEEPTVEWGILPGSSSFNKLLPEIYKRYVLGYYKGLIDEVIKVGTPYNYNDSNEVIRFHVNYFKEINNPLAVKRLRTLFNHISKIPKPIVDKTSDIFFALDTPVEISSELSGFIWFREDKCSIYFNSIDYYLLNEEQTKELRVIFAL